MVDFVDIQKHFISMLFKVPAGKGLSLIGGARLFFLNNSTRFSNDLDFHFEDDLNIKKKEIILFTKTHFIPFLKKKYSIEARIIKNHPEEENNNLKVIHLFFVMNNMNYNFPIEVTKIIAFDKKYIKSFEGTIVPTLSDQDIIEGKCLAFFSRYYFQARDLVDIWLFKNFFTEDSPERIKKKADLLNITKEDISKKINNLNNNKDYYIKQIQEVFKIQVVESLFNEIEKNLNVKEIIKELLVFFNKIN